MLISETCKTFSFEKCKAESGDGDVQLEPVIR